MKKRVSYEFCNIKSQKGYEITKPKNDEKLPKKKEGKRCKLIKVTITSNEIILTSPVRSPNHYTDYKI